MAKRLTYEEDGSALVSVVTDFTTGNQTAISDANDTILNGDVSQAAQFLELITSSNTLSGVIIKLAKAAVIHKAFFSFFWATRGGAATSAFLVEASADSTNGSDGTWVTIHSETITVEAADSRHRIFLVIQTGDERDVQSYTYLRFSLSGNSNLNNLRLNNFWVFAEYDDPPYDFYDSQTLGKITLGETLFGLFAGDAAISKTFKFRFKNNEASGTAARTYTIAFTKVKQTSDTAFAAQIRLSKDNSTTGTSVELDAVSPGDSVDFFVHIEIPKNGDSNGNPQDGAVHYGKFTVTEATVTVLPGMIFAVYYDTKANIALLAGTRLTQICLVFQRDPALPPQGAWAWWDIYGVASTVQQEDDGNDIVLLLDSSGFLWEMDRNEFDNEEHAPTAIQMVVRSLGLPADADPHIWRRNVWFDFDVEKADGGMIGEYRLHAHRDDRIVRTDKDIEIGNRGMRLSQIAVGHQFSHELRIFSGGALAIKNWAAYYQNLTIRGRRPYIAGT